MRNKSWQTIMIAAVIGFVVAMAIMAVAIYFGYTDAYSRNADTVNVSLFGLKIYSLLKNGERYDGISIGQNMGIICAIFIAVAICIEWVISKGKAKKEISRLNQEKA